jgi:hypothetical protein
VTGLCACFCISAVERSGVPRRMLRNLNRRKRTPFLPTRSCVKNAPPANRATRLTRSPS